MPDQTTTPIVVAKVVDEFTVVINRGSSHGVKNGKRFLIYCLGDDIIDPTNNQSLGKLEIVKGTGTAVHVQEMITTVRSDMTESPQRTVRKVTRVNPLSELYNMGLGGKEQVEEYLPAQAIPFEKPKSGDFARPI